MDVEGRREGDGGEKNEMLILPKEDKIKIKYELNMIAVTRSIEGNKTFLFFSNKY